MINGQLLELIVHCLADSASQRKKMIENLSVFARTRIVTLCCANEATLATEGGNDNEKLTTSLFSGWSLTTDLSASPVSLKVLLHLARIHAGFIDPADAA